ncbi:PREDICTED: uncharacterized protein LOC105148815 [Acromyrmex echinatior]|uniref:uncharacterized protein LOC105148815 n=1 Tax=Acromyrmex echinatior TaxID=103372 RepID=UPI000580CE9A|nr:PREDICTED: uncharacterized protein LOC105148815 [Acromyrmex echinatior]
MQKKIEEARKPSTSKSEKEQKTDVRCYNCGDKGDKAKNCKKKELDDSEAVADKKTTVINTVTDAPSDRMCKRITINDVRVNALIDPGSQITVMRKDIYDRMKLDKLRRNNIRLTGFGKNEVHSLGCVNIIIEVDADEYPWVVHVPNKATKSSIIIDSDFLATTEMTINNDGIIIQRATSAQSQIHNITQIINTNQRDRKATVRHWWRDEFEKKESRKYTVFVTSNGQYQFLKVPFELCNSPRVFQRYINAAFWDLIRQNIVLLYVDDLIVPAANEQEVLERLRTVLKTASDYGLQINFKKCQFVKRTIEFLVHVVEGGKIYPSQEKVKAVIDYPEPKEFKDVQSFFGLTGYFRKFISSYSTIAKPLSDMLRKDQSYNFDDKARNAFVHLRTILTQNPVLKIYYSRHETEVHTNTSIDGYGAVLLQRSDEDDLLHPVHFMSKKTKKEERNYTSYELEALAIVEALRKFRIYLLGIQFKIITDCAAFQRRWALVLEDYDYIIKHRPGNRMKHRCFELTSGMTIAKSPIIPQIRSQQANEEIQAIKEIVKNKPYKNYHISGDLLYKFQDSRDLLVIPRTLKLDVI